MKAELQLINALIALQDGRPAIRGWGSAEYASFVNMAVKGFLRADLYNTMTEFLSRAEGSFGVQVHCSMEPGVVVIASKGQPMSMSFDEEVPLVLFGSEAEAIAVPVDHSGNWLHKRIDLRAGEIMRIGAPRILIEGKFHEGKGSTSTYYYHLKNGIELR